MIQKVVKTKMGDEARQKILEGIALVSDFVKITLGPKGRNVAFNQIGPLPTRVINDGVSIAEKIRHEDPFVQAGVEMAQEICNKTNNNAGDGTSQTAFMAYTVCKLGNERVKDGENPVDIKKELESDIPVIVKKLEELSIKVNSPDQIEQVATISGNNDKEIGKAVADVFRKVGLNASILIERGNDEAIKTEITKGLWFDKGFKAPVFMNNADRGVAEYNEPLIFVINDDMRWVDDITDFFDKVVELNLVDKQFVFIAKEIEGECLKTLAETHYERMTKGGGINVLAIDAPFVGPDQKDFLEDLACYTGAKMIGADYGVKLSEILNPEEYAGSCDKLVANSKNTTIVGGKGDKKKVEERITGLKALLSQKKKSEKITSEKLEQRIDSLSSGVGVIYAGGNTEIEIKDRYLRLEDSVRASKSAIKKGIVAGGGLTYLNLIDCVKSEILKKAFTSVIKQVALNAGENPVNILSKFNKELPFNGYNANTGETENLIDAGVIDATLVIENVIKNSIGLASLFLTTEGEIVEKMEGDDKKQNV